jgi:hypothetical protein
VDDNYRLVGVVTIDDILDFLLPDDWRSHDEDDELPHGQSSTPSAGGSRNSMGKRVSHGTS